MSDLLIFGTNYPQVDKFAEMCLQHGPNSRHITRKMRTVCLNSERQLLEKRLKNLKKLQKFLKKCIIRDIKTVKNIPLQLETMP